MQLTLKLTESRRADTVQLTESRRAYTVQLRRTDELTQCSLRRTDELTQCSLRRTDEQTQCNLRRADGLTQCSSLTESRRNLRRADWLDIGVVEDDPLLGVAVQVGCDHGRVVPAHVVPACRSSPRSVALALNTVSK